MIKVEAVDISNKSNFQNIPIYPIYFQALLFLAFFTECKFSAAINALSLTKETANTSNRIYIRRGIWNQQIFLFFLTLRLTTFVWALCQSFWNKKSLNNNNFFQLEASMNLLNIFRKNKYYEQFCLKRLYKSHVIELTWRKANRANTGSLTIIFSTTWFKDGDL